MIKIFKNNTKNILDIILILCMATVCLVLIRFAYAIPIYPDEINWRVIFTRIREQGGSYFHYTLSCKPDYPIQVPWYVVPQLYILSIFRDLNTFFWFRFPQFIYLIIFYYSVYRYLNAKTSISSNGVLILIIAIFLITSSNIGLVWMLSSRPEVMILVPIGFIFYIFSRSPKSSDLLVLFFLWGLACVAHPKAVYLALPIIHIVFHLSKTIKTKLFFFAVVVAYAFGISNYAYLFIINCISEPALENRYLSYNANPLNIFLNPVYFYNEFISNFPGQWSNLLTRAPSQLIFRNGYDINHIPGVQVGAVELVLNSFISVFYYLIVIASILILPFLYLTTFFKGNRSAQIIYSIAAVVIVWILFNRTTNSYDVHLWFQLLIVVNLTLLFQRYVVSHNSIRIFGLSSLLFAIIFTFSYYSNVFIVERQKWSGIDAGPNASKIFFNKDNLLLINDFQKSFCNHNDYLLFDDRTFMALKDVPTSRPFTYFMVPFIDHDVDPKVGSSIFLHSLGRVQMIGNCAFESELPYYFTRRISKIDHLNICCFSGD